MSLQKITTENNKAVKNGVTSTGKTNNKTMFFSPLSHFKLIWLTHPCHSPTCANSEAIYQFPALQQTNMITAVPDAAKPHISQHSIVHNSSLVQQKLSVGWHSSIHKIMNRGLQILKALVFPLGSTWTGDSHWGSRTMVIIWALATESRSLSKVLAFHSSPIAGAS